MRTTKAIVAVILILLLFGVAGNEEKVLLNEGEQITYAYIDLLELDDDEKLVVLCQDLAQNKMRSSTS